MAHDFPLLDRLDLWYNEKIENEGEVMNIQQLRYVVAIANSGTFREAAEKMYVSQPSLSISVRDLEKELGFKIFRRTSSGTFLTRRGMEFYEKAQDLVKGFDIFHQGKSYPFRFDLVPV